MIRYAPYIDGTIPAFDNTKIIVPFTPNKAVGEGAAAGMVLRVKEMNGSAIDDISTEDIQNNVAYFNLPTGLIVGKYYKVQLAYKETSDENPSSLTYSSVGITKYIGNTSLSIVSEETSIDQIKYRYSCADLSENLYDYTLDIKTGETLVRTITGYHNNNSTIITISPPLLSGITYDYSLKATTINKYEMIINSGNSNNDPKPIFQKNSSLSTDSSIVESDSEYGEVKILQDEGTPSRLIRYINSDLDGVILSNPDNTGEHGVIYKYGLVDDSGNRTLCEQSIEKMCVFEDMFLQDATHTLRIKFNPKVSSFKTTIQESKQDTLGSKYPYFFRNGDSYYNEFPISGLVSYHMQDNEKFMNDTQLGLVESSGKRSNTDSTGTIESKVRTTNLTDYNVAAERKFKLAVLEWLNNGKPKLFRSPTEGNYIVRLMNVSLSPEDRLGRMLHTFNATAIEVSDKLEDAYGQNVIISGGNIIKGDTANLIDLDNRYVLKSELLEQADKVIDTIDGGGWQEQ